MTDRSTAIAASFGIDATGYTTLSLLEQQMVQVAYNLASAERELAKTMTGITNDLARTRRVLTEAQAAGKLTWVQDLGDAGYRMTTLANRMDHLRGTLVMLAGLRPATTTPAPTAEDTERC